MESNVIYICQSIEHIASSEFIAETYGKFPEHCILRERYKMANAIYCTLCSEYWGKLDTTKVFFVQLATFVNKALRSLFFLWIWSFTSKDVDLTQLL